MSDQVRVVVVLQADPGKGGEQVAAFASLAPLVRAEQGCLQYDLHAVDGEPDRFVILEQWESRADLDAHLGSAHMAEYGEQVGAFRQRPAEIHVITPERIA